MVSFRSLSSSQKASIRSRDTAQVVNRPSSGASAGTTTSSAPAAQPNLPTNYSKLSDVAKAKYGAAPVSMITDKKTGTSTTYQGTQQISQAQGTQPYTSKLDAARQNAIAMASAQFQQQGFASGSISRDIAAKAAYATINAPQVKKVAVPTMAATPDMTRPSLSPTMTMTDSAKVEQARDYYMGKGNNEAYGQKVPEKAIVGSPSYQPSEQARPSFFGALMGTKKPSDSSNKIISKQTNESYANQTTNKELNTNMVSGINYPGQIAKESNQTPKNYPDNLNLVHNETITAQEYKNVSVYKEAEKQTGWYNLLERKGEEAKIKEIRATSDLSKWGYKAESLGLGAAAGVVGIGTMFVHPIQSIKGTAQATVEAVKDPFGTGAKAREAVMRKPEFIVGESAAQIATGEVIGKLGSLAKGSSTVEVLEAPKGTVKVTQIAGEKTAAVEVTSFGKYAKRDWFGLGKPEEITVKTTGKGTMNQVTGETILTEAKFKTRVEAQGKTYAGGAYLESSTNLGKVAADQQAFVEKSISSDFLKTGNKYRASKGVSGTKGTISESLTTTIPEVKVTPMEGFEVTIPKEQTMKMYKIESASLDKSTPIKKVSESGLKKFMQSEDINTLRQKSKPVSVGKGTSDILITEKSRFDYDYSNVLRKETEIKPKIVDFKVEKVNVWEETYSNPKRAAEIKDSLLRDTLTKAETNRLRNELYEMTTSTLKEPKTIVTPVIENVAVDKLSFPKPKLIKEITSKGTFEYTSRLSKDIPKKVKVGEKTIAEIKLPSAGGFDEFPNLMKKDTSYVYREPIPDTSLIPDWLFGEGKEKIIRVKRYERGIDMPGYAREYRAFETTKVKSDINFKGGKAVGEVRTGEFYKDFGSVKIKKNIYEKPLQKAETSILGEIQKGEQLKTGEKPLTRIEKVGQKNIKKSMPFIEKLRALEKIPRETGSKIKDILVPQKRGRFKIITKEEQIKEMRLLEKEKELDKFREQQKITNKKLSEELKARAEYEKNRKKPLYSSNTNEPVNIQGSSNGKSELGRSRFNKDLSGKRRPQEVELVMEEQYSTQRPFADKELYQRFTENIVSQKAQEISLSQAKKLPSQSKIDFQSASLGLRQYEKRKEISGGKGLMPTTPTESIPRPSEPDRPFIQPPRVKPFTKLDRDFDSGSGIMPSYKSNQKQTPSTIITPRQDDIVDVIPKKANDQIIDVVPKKIKEQALIKTPTIMRDFYVPGVPTPPFIPPLMPFKKSVSTGGGFLGGEPKQTRDRKYQYVANFVGVETGAKVEKRFLKQGYVFSGFEARGVLGKRQRQLRERLYEDDVWNTKKGKRKMEMMI